MDRVARLLEPRSAARESITHTARLHEFNGLPRGSLRPSQLPLPWEHGWRCGCGELGRWLRGFSGLCKNCRQTPIFTILVFPHFSHSPQSARKGYAEGTRVILDRSGTVIGTN